MIRTGGGKYWLTWTKEKGTHMNSKHMAVLIYHSEHQLRFVLAKAPTPPLALVSKIAGKPGDRLEISAESLALIQDMSIIFKKVWMTFVHFRHCVVFVTSIQYGGGALIIDYGEDFTLDNSLRVRIVPVSDSRKSQLP